MKVFPESIGFFEVAHTADIAIAVTGDSIKSLFVQSYFALKEITQVAMQEKISESDSNRIHAKSMESLLIAFLNEIIVFLDQELWPVIQNIEIEDGCLNFSFALHHCVTHGSIIKAVTYSEVEIIHHSGLFSTMLVFDV